MFVYADFIGFHVFQFSRVLKFQRIFLYYVAKDILIHATQLVLSSGAYLISEWIRYKKY